MPNPVGRPPTYDPKFCKDFINHMKQGGSIEGFGAYLGELYGDEYAVSKRAVYDWFENHEEFGYTKEIALSYSRKFFDDLGNSGMAGQLKRLSREIVHPNGDKERKFAAAYFNDKAWALNMKNRFGWKDKQEIDNTSSDGSMKPQVIITLPDNGKGKKR